MKRRVRRSFRAKIVVFFKRHSRMLLGDLLKTQLNGSDYLVIGFGSITTKKKKKMDPKHVSIPTYGVNLRRNYYYHFLSQEPRKLPLEGEDADAFRAVLAEQGNYR